MAGLKMGGLEGHEALNADAPEHNADDYAGAGDWGGLLAIWNVKKKKKRGPTRTEVSPQPIS